MDSLREKLSNIELSELPEEHQKRFEDKLDNYLNNYSKKKYLYVFSFSAAVAVITILFILFINNPSAIKTGKQEVILSTENHELIETEKFLQYQINYKLNLINSLNMKEEKKVIIHDLKEFDKTLLRLKSDYKKVPGDERVVNAIISTYILKIEAIDNIMNKLKKYS
jgi:hypothetical protein